jgi:hypothetical protein
LPRGRAPAPLGYLLDEIIAFALNIQRRIFVIGLGKADIGQHSFDQLRVLSKVAADGA